MTPARINLRSSLDATGADDTWSSGFVNPRWDLRCDPRTLHCQASAGTSAFKSWDDPLEALAWMTRTFANDNGRWIGHIGYDFGRIFEPAWGTRLAPPDTLNLPLFRFTYCVPTGERRTYAPEPNHPTSNAPLTSSFTRQRYEDAVRRAIEYIAAGDVFQVNLSQRFTVGLTTQPAYIYQWLVRNAPARYGAYLNYDDYCLISNSPELFLKIDGRKITTRPIKGTRPLGQGMADELLKSSKDAAELNMIVDLERNDLGRVCETGTVRVAEPRHIEQHPTVYHGVAAIEGTLRADVTLVDVLRAAFPGGSVTGAPKIRAMQIIDELEPVARNAYCGAIGYVARDSRCEFNLAIRTMTAKDGLVHIPVGGGIVADSTCAAEYDETLVKARAMFDALGIASPANGGASRIG
ncbi:MAG TPA: anthranilate synthase component I family protein [Tepidisphaeraceae bacterium]|nr:anthranilate synthase component I family protein [Tepidisphaeraceae bacterium]